MHSHLAPLIQHLSNIDTRALLNRISNFSKISISQLSDSELHQEILKVLLDCGHFFYIRNMHVYNNGTEFFRVRRLSGSTFPNKEINIEQDFWSPPSTLIKKYGRINKPNESMLYASPINPHTAMKEMKILDGEFFALIIYDAATKIQVNVIGGSYDYERIGITDKNAIINHEILNKFLKDEFCRDVGIGTEFLYRTSEIIAKSYFDLPPRDVQDAWLYPSMQDKTNYNICFRPEIARDVLSLRGAVIAKSCNNGQILAVAVTRGFDKEGNALYYEIGSDVQKKFFPAILVK